MLRNKKYRHYSSSIFALLIWLSGCSTFQQAGNIASQANAGVQDNSVPAPGVVETVDAPYILGDAVQAAPMIDPILNEPITFKVGYETLDEIASQVSQATGIAVDDEALQDFGSITTNSAATSGGLPPPPTATLGALGSSAPQPEFSINYEGTRDGLLDVIGSRAGVSWRFDDGKITIFHVETKTFIIPALNRAANDSTQIADSSGNGMSSGGASNGSGSSSSDNMGDSMTVTDTSESDVWKDIEATAQTLSGNAQISADPSTGMLTVTGTPDQIQQVSDWVNSLSDTLSKQVSVTIQIFKIQIANEQNYGFDPTVEFENAAKSFGLSYAGASMPAVQGTATPASFGASILSTATGTSGLFKGSNVAIQALATLGQVHQIFSRSFTSINGQQAPIQVATNTAYLCSSSTTTTANVGSTSSLQQCTLTTGFMGSVTPQVVGGKIMLGVDLKISALTSLQTITSGGSSLELPTSTDTEVTDSAFLNSGDSLMISGYQESDGNSTNNGVGSPYLPIFGGGGDAQTTKTMLAIIVTANQL